MIAVWMLFAIVLGLLLGIAAAALEPLLVARHRPRRVAWLGAMLLAILWPAAAVLAGRTMAPTRLGPILVSPVGDPFARASGYVAGPFAARVDVLLLAAWAATTLLLLIRLAAARRRLDRERGRWAATSLDGVPVRLSDDVGPAVVGLRSTEIVLPSWALALDEPLRALVLQHEEEHRAARDPHLTLFAALAVALLPWNVALWWHARRLRLAVEMDCDARVLRVQPHPERYGLLLLAIAQRKSAATPPLVPALSEPASDLERRIAVMRMTTPVRSRLALCSVAAIAALALACSLKAPSENPEGVFREFQLTKQAMPLPDNQGPRYPDALREAKVEGEVVVQFVVDATGRVDMSTVRVLRSTDPQFTAAMRESLASWRFTPAEVNGRPVKQLLEIPFQFKLGPPPPPPGASLPPR
jgi:TonB family protein